MAADIASTSGDQIAGCHYVSASWIYRLLKNLTHASRKGGLTTGGQRHETSAFKYLFL